jgi:ATP:ADP antiporter, AAA family
MLHRVRRFLDVRPGEGLPVLLTFLYIWVVVASFLLAKPIRSGLFLGEHDAYDLVYVYAAVPLVLSLFVPGYTRVAGRIGARRVTVATLLFFSLNVVVFWYLFRFQDIKRLPDVFFVWVSCYGVIAPVQAWSFANSLFDTRQAKRLFGLIGAGASLGAMSAGVLARVLVEPVGGPANLLLVLALLIALAAAIVLFANFRIRRVGLTRRGRPISPPFAETWREIIGTPYLRLLAGLVFAVAIATQWSSLQLGVVSKQHFQSSQEITEFYGTFSFVTGVLSFVVQLFITGRVLRNWGMSAGILALPLALATGNVLIFLAPGFWSVLVTNGFDQGLRFSVDKATYELLYLPIAPGKRVSIKNAIDIVGNRIADAVGAVLLGLATNGFLFLPGLHLGLRGTAAINLVTVGIWTSLAWSLRSEYIRTIQDSIHRHRLDTERGTAAVTERSAADVLTAKLAAADLSEVRYALDLIEGQRTRKWFPALRTLLTHPDPEVRRRSLAILSAAGDEQIADRVPPMLRDPDLGVRTEALLYLSRESGVDPLRQIQELGDFEDFSIRAGAAAFLAAPGPAQNLDAARLMVDAMARATGDEGRRDRAEAARLIGSVHDPAFLLDLLPVLIIDEDIDVARQAVRSAYRVATEELIPPLMIVLGRADLAEDAAEALARLGNRVVPTLSDALRSEEVPIEVRRELPSVLLRIGTSAAEQALVSSLLESDGTVRHRVIASLNKLRAVRPDIRIDPSVLELLLAAEIAGHYRSYQVLGPLEAQLKREDAVIDALRHSMEQELERIFRLMALLLPQAGLHDAYVGVRSSNPTVRANALEFLDNVLKPELRQVLVPLLDSHVTVQERIALANRLVGAPLETSDQAVATLLASDDPWLRSCAIQAVGTLQLRSLAPELKRYEDAADPLVREAVVAARARLAGDARALLEPQHPAPADLDVGVGAG